MSPARVLEKASVVEAFQTIGSLFSESSRSALRLSRAVWILFLAVFQCQAYNASDRGASARRHRQDQRRSRERAQHASDPGVLVAREALAAPGVVRRRLGFGVGLRARVFPRIRVHALVVNQFGKRDELIYIFPPARTLYASSKAIEALRAPRGAPQVPAAQ